MGEVDGDKKTGFREVFASAKKRKLQEIQKELMESGGESSSSLPAPRKKKTKPPKPLHPLQKEPCHDQEDENNHEHESVEHEKVGYNGVHGDSGTGSANDRSSGAKDRASDAEAGSYARLDIDDQEAVHRAETKSPSNNNDSDSANSSSSSSSSNSSSSDDSDDDSDQVDQLVDDDDDNNNNNVESRKQGTDNTKRHKPVSANNNHANNQRQIQVDVDDDEETTEDEERQHTSRAPHGGATGHTRTRPTVIVTPLRSKMKASSATKRSQPKKATTIPCISFASSPNTPSTPGVCTNATNELSVKMPEFYETRAFSNVKDYFVPVTTPTGTDPAHVQCTVCKLLIGNRNYSLKRHLYRHHREVFQLERTISVIKEEADVQEETFNDQAGDAKGSETLANENKTKMEEKTTGKFRIQIASSSRASMTCSENHNQKNQKRRKVVDEETLRINTALLAWLRLDCIPLKAFENRLFSNFVSKLHGSYKVPELVVQSFTGGMNEFKQGRDDLEAAEALTGRPKMRGFVLTGPGSTPQLVQDLDRPRPEKGEALIRVLRSGFCATDAELVRGYKLNYVGVLGHEFVGIVEQVHPSCSKQLKTQWIGQRVVGEINMPCNNTDGDCSICETSFAPEATVEQKCRRRNHCPKRRCLGILAKDGCLAEYITLPVANLFRVPESLMDSHAVFAEPVAAACRIFEQNLIEPADRVAVVGDGKLGLLIVEVIQAYDLMNQVTLIGKHKHKMALAGKLVEQVEFAATLGSALQDRFDVCIECTGTPSAVQFASQIVKPKGKLVIKTTCSQDKNTIDSVALGVKQVHLVGSRCGNFDRALELLVTRKVDPQKFIEAAYPLSQVDSAFEHATRRGSLKVQVVMLP